MHPHITTNIVPKEVSPNQEESTMPLPAEMWSYSLKINKVYLEIIDKATGKPKQVPIIQRTLYLERSGGVTCDPRRWKIFQVRRREKEKNGVMIAGSITYAISNI